MKRVLYRPSLIFSYMFKLETMRLGAFFGGFGALFRVSNSKNYTYVIVE